MPSASVAPTHHLLFQKYSYEKRRNNSSHYRHRNSLKTSWVKHEVTPASNIRDEVGLESIDFLDMIQQVEMMFHIKITPEEAKDCKLVSDVIALTEQKINIQHSTFNTK